MASESPEPEASNLGLDGSNVRQPICRVERTYGDTFASDNAHTIRGDVFNITHGIFTGNPPRRENDAKQALHEALNYEGMNQRVRQLSLPEIPPESFEWIWSTPFPEWLTTSSAFFWITGKPGSGKSTLMHYLCNTQRCQDYLDRNTRKYEILKFFFDFRAAHSDANDPKGLLKMFLSQLIDHSRDTEDFLVNKNVRRQLADADKYLLLNTFCDAAKKLSFRVCAFVDGLDEYHGDHSALVSVLYQLQDRTGMKIILACRPERIFQSSFNGFTQLRMQDHNGASIRAYIDHAIKKGQSSLAATDVLFNDNTCKEIQHRAQGVIIWARLAVDELLHAAQKPSLQESTQDILDRLPGDLEKMYDRILLRLERHQSAECAFLLYLINEYGGEMDVEVLRDLWCYFHSDIFGQIERPPKPKLEAFVLRVIALIGSLTDITETGSASAWRSYFYDIGERVGAIRLMHKTVGTYLTQSTLLLSLLPQSFRSKYPNSLPLRQVSEILSDATTQFDYSSTSQGLCNYVKKHPRGDMGRYLKPLLLAYEAHLNEHQTHPVSIAILRYSLHYILFGTADTREEHVYELLRPALTSPMVMLFATTRQYAMTGFKSFLEIRYDFLLCQREQCSDLLLALIVGLPEYFSERVARDVSQSQAVCQVLLNTAITSSAWHYDVSLDRWEKLLSYLVHRVEALRCDFIETWLNMMYTHWAEEHFSSLAAVLLSFLSSSRIDWNTSPQRCGSGVDSMHVWIAYGKEDHLSKTLLYFTTRDIGQIVTSSCRWSGTTLHLIVARLLRCDNIYRYPLEYYLGWSDGRPFGKSGRRPYYDRLLYDKFILLTKIGADPDICHQGKTPLQMLADRRWKSKIRQLATFGLASDEWPETAELMYTCLKYHKRHGKWPTGKDLPNNPEPTKIAAWQIDADGKLIL